MTCTVITFRYYIIQWSITFEILTVPNNARRGSSSLTIISHFKSGNYVLCGSTMPADGLTIIIDPFACLCQLYTCSLSGSFTPLPQYTHLLEISYYSIIIACTILATQCNTESLIIFFNSFYTP